jgi:hypothetical protein
MVEWGLSYAEIVIVYDVVISFPLSRCFDAVVPFDIMAVVVLQGTKGHGGGECGVKMVI